MKNITWSKKAITDGTPSRESFDVRAHLEQERLIGLIGRIDRRAIADERDPGSGGMRLADTFGVEQMPLIIAEELSGETRVLQMLSQPRNYLLQQSELFDADGFLLDTVVWTQEISRLIAEREGIAPLTTEHWALIDFVRGYYSRFAVPPSIRQVCRSVKVEKEAVRRLFGGCRSLWRVAGLLNPGEEAMSYVS